MEGVTIDPSELNTRYMLASTIRKSGEQAIASGEYAKILILDPDHIPARMTRALEAINGRHFAQAECDFDVAIESSAIARISAQGPALYYFASTKRLIDCRWAERWRKAELSPGKHSISPML